MIVNKLFFSCSLFFCMLALQAQEISFGNILKQDLKQTSSPDYPDAVAEVLAREVKVQFLYVENDGFHQITSVHERVKIYNKDGFKYATVRENLRKIRRENVVLSSLKGFTYNLADGKIVKTRLKGSDSFKESLNKYYDRETFTMPEVREGSIIEYQYRIDSPFWYILDEIDLQYDIPIREQEITVVIPEYFSFKPLMKGYLPVRPIYGNVSGKFNYVAKTGGRNLTNDRTWSNRSIDYMQTSTRFHMKQVPPLENEPYVNNIDNYRTAVNFELEYVEMPNEPREYYSNSWEKVIKTIYENDSFGRQLNQGRHFDEVLQPLLANAQTEAEKAGAILLHLQQHMTWNGYLGYSSENGVRKAYEERTGNSGDINLLLVAMLKEAGLDADPVLISTRDNGVPMFPTLEGFNYVVAALTLEGGKVLLDASNKYATPNRLPTRALNWNGMLVRKDKSYQSLSLMPTSHSKEVNMLNLQMGKDGMVKGKMRTTLTDYRAYEFRNKNNGMQEEAYLDWLSNKYGGIDVSSHEIVNAYKLGKPVVEQFEFAMEQDRMLAGDRLVFNPQFFLAQKETPFKLEERMYPVDFTYPIHRRDQLNIYLPEGYTVVSLPESISLVLEDDLGSFSFQIKKQGDSQLQLVSDLKINRAVVPSNYYPSLKEFYKKIAEKESEQVVLSKITGDGLTKSAAGGR